MAQLRTKTLINKNLVTNFW